MTTLSEEDVECYRAQYLQLIRLVASSPDVRDSISTMHYDPKSRIHLPGDFGEWHTELRWLDRIDPVTDSLFEPQNPILQGFARPYTVQTADGKTSVCRLDAVLCQNAGF